LIEQLQLLDLLNQAIPAEDCFRPVPWQ